MSEVLKFNSVLCTKTNNYLTVLCTEINICKFMRGYKHVESQGYFHNLSFLGRTVLDNIASV